MPPTLPICVCTSSFIPLRLVYLCVRCSDITTRSSTIWSRLNDWFISSPLVWKDPIFPKYPPLGQSLTLCANDGAAVQHVWVLQSQDLTSLLCRNTEFQVPDAGFYLHKKTFFHHSWCFSKKKQTPSNSLLRGELVLVSLKSQHLKQMLVADGCQPAWKTVWGCFWTTFCRMIHNKAEKCSWEGTFWADTTCVCSDVGFVCC